jgi:hypothetical protein
MTSFDLPTLPVDLLSEVLSKMTIEDVANLKTATGNREEASTIGLECEHVMSVSRYLKRTLGLGTELLTVLSKCFAYIGGSRSLEFFVPGCIDESSDLDIYVPDMTNMGKCMRLLHELGVEWYGPEKAIRDCVEQGGGKVILSGSSLFSLRTSGVLQTVCTDIGFKLVDFINIHSLGMMILAVENREVRSFVAPENMGYAEPSFLGITNGFITHKNKAIKVQLICESRASGLMGVDGLARYHSSCVQSFIGGHFACHLHGKSASRKESYGWPTNVNDVEVIGKQDDRPNIFDMKKHGLSYIVPGWAKYEKRGFKYIDAPTSSLRVHRRLFDSESTMVEYPNEVGAPDVVASAYRDAAEQTWWYQNITELGGIWLTTESMDMCDYIIGHPWFESDNVHEDEKYLRKYHVAQTFLISDEKEIIAEID